MPRRRSLLAAGLVAVAVVGAGALMAASDGEPAVRTERLTVAGVPEPTAGGGSVPVPLDATVYLPAGTGRAPAVLLAHGFGGDRTDLDAEARDLARRGYVALAYTARGFGRSGGLIHLDSPDYEVADARRLLDVLAARPDVLLDGPGDPRVGVVGGSYGGALALLLAGYDHRVDAIVPQITWNDLRQALFPQFATAAGAPRSPAGFDPAASPGVFKKGWAGVFFSPQAGAAGDPADAAAAAAVGGAGTGCGRFAPALCTAYQQAATTGRPTSAMLDLLARSSPARVLDRIEAPTLLVQGEADSLFPLSEADANARGIAATGTPVKVIWFSGGHDAGTGTDAETGRITGLAHAWLDRYLRHRAAATTTGTTEASDTRFEVTVPSAAVSSVTGRATSQLRALPGLPGVTARELPATRAVPLSAPSAGRGTGASDAGTGARASGQVGTRAGGQVAAPVNAQVVQAPPGASPAAVTVVPGLGGALSRLAATGAASSLSALPEQVAVFESAPLATTARIVGGSRATLRVSGDGTDATLFAQLYDVDPAGTAVLPAGLVAPVHLARVDAAGQEVTVALPAIVRDVAAGHRLRLVISTTDSGYAMPADPRRYRIELTGDLIVPDTAMTAVAGDGVRGLWPWALALLVATGAVVAGLRLARRRRRGGPADPALADVPLAVEGLGKAYGDGFRAVSDLSFRVEPGRVLGLLGPNGAGKTTTLRMLMGLIRPTEGTIRVFGHPVSPGAPVLSRVGAFVEGPGFLPHVSGVHNLRLYWQATGRPAADAHLDEALEIAGLGDDVHRRVKTYSQGMRQRLAIAQAMLGLPDLLVLDEPTNGLDPPQIREMREVLARYAATGRTVVVSSHLLSEVEQTCTHVVVMHRGTLVAAGPVAELAGSATALVVDVDDPGRAAAVARTVPGAQEVTVTATGLTLDLVGTSRGDLVRALVEAGLAVDRVTPRRGLEEAFLALVGEG